LKIILNGKQIEKFSTQNVRKIIKGWEFGSPEWGEAESGKAGALPRRTDLPGKVNPGFLARSG